jgi:hypothetical protein
MRSIQQHTRDVPAACTSWTRTDRIYRSIPPFEEVLCWQKNGSSGRTRTYNPPVNSRKQRTFCQLLSVAFDVWDWRFLGGLGAP